MTEYIAFITCKATNVVDHDHFNAVTDQVASCLFSLADGAGASFTTQPRARTVTFGFKVEARNKSQASAMAEVIARTALHASGGATRNWDNTVPKEWPDTFKKVTSKVKTERELQTA